MSESKQDFINNEFWVLTFGAAFQHAGVYAPNVDARTKAIFRLGIVTKIEMLVLEEYSTMMVGSEDHMANLLWLKDWIDEVFPQVLRGYEIKLGVVQKLLNMYLKYQWCNGNIQEPPHCPFDRKIISELGFKYKERPVWTKINTIEEYMELVEAAERMAVDKTLSQWELETFERG